MMKSKLLILLYLCSGFSIHSKAQSFQWEAKVGPVKEAGFYNILVTPEIASHVNDNFSDLRLFDSRGQETGYLFRAEEPEFLKDFRNYKIVENTSKPNCCSRLVLENSLKGKINNILLKIRNSDVYKKAVLTGSDDRESWYIIKDSYDLVSLYEQEDVSKVIQLHFPLSNYRYYKLEIDDSTSAPLQILEAGYFDNYHEDAKYLPLPLASINQKDSSDKKSYVRISFPSRQYLSKIKIDCEGTFPYFRKGALYSLDTSGQKERLTFIQNIHIKSGQQHVFHLDGIFAGELLVVIENNDNIPLKIRKVTGYQLIHYLTANLKKDESYTLKFGNDELSFPQYDLEYFRDTLSTISQVISPQEVQFIPQSVDIKEKEPAETLWLWLSIGGIGVFLTLMSVKMIKEMKG